MRLVGGSVVRLVRVGTTKICYRYLLWSLLAFILYIPTIDISSFVLRVHLSLFMSSLKH